MLNHPTYERLTQLRLTGMARALAEQAQHPDIQALTFEERLGLLVEREAAEGAVMTRLRQADQRKVAVEREPAQIPGAEGERDEAPGSEIHLPEFAAPGVEQPQPALMPAR